MANRTKVEFKTNLPEVVKFLFPEPKEAQSQYGTSYMYGVEHNGKNSVIFATKLLNDKIQSLGIKKGDVVKIAKVENGTKKDWNIVVLESNTTSTSVSETKSDAVKSPVASNSQTEFNSLLNQYFEIRKRVIDANSLISEEYKILNHEEIQNTTISLLIETNRRGIVLAKVDAVEIASESNAKEDLPF
jgi:hypothetical protein